MRYDVSTKTITEVEQDSGLFNIHCFSDMNEDGTYFPMNNPYNFPTSEFIPLGKEKLAKHVTHICPCSDPNVVSTCDNCDHPCYELNFGEKKFFW